MWKYGQYCPLAHAMEIVGDRWTLLIIRDMMGNSHHFNELERGLPGISRGLLSSRLKLLERTGVIEKRFNAGRKSTEYRLTEAGWELAGAIEALVGWGAKWVFDDPAQEELDSGLLIWWVYKGINIHQLPEYRVVVQFDFTGAETARYWLVLTMEEVNLCVTHPGYDVNILVTADLATFFKVWAGRITYGEAVAAATVQVDGIPSLIRAFPTWFQWSLAAPEVAHARNEKK